MDHCAYCGKETRNPRFCSRRCSAKGTNREAPKRKLQKSFCRCGKDLQRVNWKDRRTLCDDCNSHVLDFDSLTLESIVGKRLYQKHSRVRNLARRQYLKSKAPKICSHCGYDKHFEVCHIKAIAEFPSSTLVKVINHPSNLMALCRNCHWELDNGLLQLAFPEFEGLHS